MEGSDGTCILCGLTLGVIEVGRDSDDSMLDFLSCQGARHGKHQTQRANHGKYRTPAPRPWLPPTAFIVLPHPPK